MQIQKLTLLSFFLCMNLHLWAQKTPRFEEINAKSYALYESASWKALLQYGKESVASGEDFVYLRLRMAYAAFMLQKYSEALKQYEAVFAFDKSNETGHYYSRLCLIYLNKKELADQHLKYFSDAALLKEKIHPIAFTTAGIEASYKTPDFALRGNSIYTRIDISNRWHRNIHMDQGFAIFNQTINEPKLPAVLNNNSIAINQKEYYNRIHINLSRHWQLKTSYHYIYTPFNNFEYNNHAFMAAIKYHGAYVDVQADAIFSRLTDTARQQYDVQLGYYPLGNLNLYGFSTLMIRNSENNNAVNVKQVIGCKLYKNTWLEGNATFGDFSNLFENDALYIYNAIDRNTFKGGATLYLMPGPKLTVHVGYTFEQRNIYLTNNTFNQHSITGGLSWKL